MNNQMSDWVTYSAFEVTFLQFVHEFVYFVDELIGTINQLLNFERWKPNQKKLQH